MGRMDQGKGVVIEFPLNAVRAGEYVLKLAGTHPVSSHAVVLSFTRRRMAFAFPEQATAQKFQMGMELLCCQANESPEEKEKVSDRTSISSVPRLRIPKSEEENEKLSDRTSIS